MSRYTLTVAAAALALFAAACGGASSSAPETETTTNTSTPATRTTAPAAPVSKPRVLRATIEGRNESPDFLITMSDESPAPGRYTLIVNDMDTWCDFHMWGPGVDVISADGVNRFEIRLQDDGTYIATCNASGIDNMAWNTEIHVAG